MGDTRQNTFSSTLIVDPAEIFSDEEIREEKVTLLSFCFATPLEGIKWCAKRKLIKNSNNCENCNIPMTCSRNSRIKSDGYQWICKKCKKQRGLRINSFFERSKLSLKKIMLLIYGWALEYPQEMINIEADIGSNRTTIDWYNFCREVCESYFIENDIAIGGINEDGSSKTVEIDESKFFHRKYHRGRWNDGHWVFGGIERESRRCFLVEVPDRTETTLAAVIERHILPGTIIVSDGWRAYGNISNMCGGVYEHKVIIHEDNFVDPNDDSVHTQNVENMWMRAKKKLRRQFGQITNINFFGTPEQLWSGKENTWRADRPDDDIKLSEFQKLLKRPGRSRDVEDNRLI